MHAKTHSTTPRYSCNADLAVGKYGAEMEDARKQLRHYHSVCILSNLPDSWWQLHFRCRSADLTRTPQHRLLVAFALVQDRGSTPTLPRHCQGATEANRDGGAVLESAPTPVPG